MVLPRQVIIYRPKRDCTTVIAYASPDDHNGKKACKAEIKTQSLAPCPVLPVRHFAAETNSTDYALQA